MVSADVTDAPTVSPAGPGERWRARWASDPRVSCGRVHAEPESPHRSAFQRDRDRIIHSSAFRRLKHKTQVFVSHEGDHYRTRLTHTIEVAQIARAMALRLGLDDDLAEALALAHDLGHPPFGHAGEAALAEAMAAFGGFDHNAHTLRLLTQLERRYAEFDGLNLSWETLEGVVKHNGPLLTAPAEQPGAGGGETQGARDAGADLPWALTAYPSWRGLELHTHAGLEAQVAALADDIAYNNHDLDDGLRAGLFTVDDIADLPLVGEMFARVSKMYPGLETPRLIHEAVRRLVGLMVDDCVGETTRRLDALKPASAADIRDASAATAAFSAELSTADKALRTFLFANMYRHSRVNRKMRAARRIVAELFEAFIDDPGLLPGEWRERAGAPASVDAARAIADYIAGMTDRFAIEEHRRLFEVHAVL